MSLRLVPRPACELRCAYCHGDLGEGLPCPRCATALHGDCWVLAGTCPSLGCRPARAPLRVRLLEAEVSGWLLASWLAVLGVVWAALTWVVPEFARMFREVGLCTTLPTDALFALSRFAAHPAGGVSAALVVVGSIGLYGRRRRSAWVRRGFAAGSLLGALLVPFALLALFCPCCVLTQKL